MSHYLDLNHNGVLDEMEPNISTQSGVEITFQNNHIQV